MRLLLVGAMGHMGQEVVKLANERDDIALFPVDQTEGSLTLLDAENWEGDAILDFSHHSAICHILSFAKKKKCPLVIATTGHDEHEKREIMKAAKEIPILLSENLSLGIQLFFRMAVELLLHFGEGDGEIFEIHRKGKADRPSGTAKRLRAYLEERKADLDIPIHAIRLGDTVGTHSFVFGNAEESISITHTVHSRRLFAKGGIAACTYLIGQPAGLYRMEDTVKKQ